MSIGLENSTIGRGAHEADMRDVLKDPAVFVGDLDVVRLRSGHCVCLVYGTNLVFEGAFLRPRVRERRLEFRDATCHIRQRAVA